MTLEDLQSKLDDARGENADDSVHSTQPVNNASDNAGDNAGDNADGTNDVKVGDEDNYDDSAAGKAGSLDDGEGQYSNNDGRKTILEKIQGILGKNQDDSSHEEDGKDGQDGVNADLDAEEANKGAGEDKKVDEPQAQDQQSHNMQKDDTFVDPRFMTVAREYGWTDVDIMAYASKNGAVDQVQLANNMEAALGEGEAPAEGADDDVALVSDEVLAKLSEDEDNAPIVNDVVKPLLAKVQELSKSLNEVQGTQQAQDEGKKNENVMQDYDFANAEFDRHAKDFPILGSTDSLKSLPDGTLDVTDPTVQVRREVFTRAMQYKQFNPNSTMSQAMEDAMVWFRGKHGAEQMERNILAKLDKNSKRVAPKSKGRAGGKKFATPRDRKRAVVNSALEKHNKQLR